MSTKQELIREFAEVGITQKEARTYSQDLIDEITNRLSNGEDVQITNFGRFELRQHKGRTMTNPRTGEKHDIPDRFIVHFTPSKNLKERFRDE